jgi:hypothetical protein
VRFANVNLKSPPITNDTNDDEIVGDWSSDNSERLDWREAIQAYINGDAGSKWPWAWPPNSMFPAPPTACDEPLLAVPISAKVMIQNTADDGSRELTMSINPLYGDEGDAGKTPGLVIRPDALFELDIQAQPESTKEAAKPPRSIAVITSNSNSLTARSFFARSDLNLHGMSPNNAFGYVACVNERKGPGARTVSWDIFNRLTKQGSSMTWLTAVIPTDISSDMKDPLGASEAPSIGGASAAHEGYLIFGRKDMFMREEHVTWFQQCVQKVCASMSKATPDSTERGTE